MKIGWGTKIAMLYIGFVVLIVSLVVATLFKKTTLVADNYYEQETTYQKRINAEQASQSIGDIITIQATAEAVNLAFPKVFDGKALSGTVHFYAPSDEKADRNFPINCSNGAISIERSQLAKINYEVQVSWTAAGKDYYQSLPLNLLNR